MNTGNPMKITLYPYNLYFLYAAAGIVVVFLIMTLSHLSSMGRTLNDLLDKSTALTEKTEQLQEVLTARAEQKPKLPLKKILAGWILLNAVKKDYNKHEENGMRQAVKSAQTVYNERLLKKIISSNRTNIL